MIAMSTPMKKRSGKHSRKKGGNKASNAPSKAYQLLLWLADIEDDPQPGKECRPTDAWPGTNKKIRVLAERYERGLPLWHKEDFQWGKDGED